MDAIPTSYKEIDPSAAVLYLTLHIESAMKILLTGSIPTLGNHISNPALVALGVGRFNISRGARELPRPWMGKVGEFAQLDVTPCTRASFASVTGQNGAVSVERRDVVSFAFAHDELRAHGSPLIYTDRLCTRDDARFSGDRDLLRRAAWDRIRTRNFRPDAGDPAAVHHYDASVLAWGAIPITAAKAIVCKDSRAVERFRRDRPGLPVPVLARGDLLW